MIKIISTDVPSCGVRTRVCRGSFFFEWWVLLTTILFSGGGGGGGNGLRSRFVFTMVAGYVVWVGFKFDGS